MLPHSLLLLLAALCGVRASKLAGTWVIVGETGVSAQQLVLGTNSTIYILDKAENNSATINKHPAWATEYNYQTNTYRTMDIVTNSFCAGGAYMGNGTLLNVGGNNAVTTGGVSDSTLNLTTAQGAFDDQNGGQAARMLTPCSNLSCNWSDDLLAMPVNRWYPSLETLADGSVVIIGGEMWGGYVNSVNQHQNTPSWEFMPSRGAPQNITFLADTQPANLYPLTWLLPDGTLFMQASWQATLINVTSLEETRLPNITHAQKTYPASGATAMLPLTAENNYEPTLLFCGGMDPERDDWDADLWTVIDTPTSSSCVSINPMDDSPTWVDDDDLLENRGMGNFIILPNQMLFLAGGVSYGSAGYGTQNWTEGQSYAKDPVLSPAIYNHSAPAGSRFSRKGLSNSTVGRLYHSSATLLPDGSSNPNADVITEFNNASYPYKTEYRAERFYPSYYDDARPEPTGLPSSLSYGGDYYNVTLSASSMTGATGAEAYVHLIRTGFATHAINFGQRSLVFNSTFTTNSDSSVTLHVPQLPPNANLFPPGPALLFVIVNGVPSLGEFVMVGSGNIETQPILAAQALPQGNGTASSSTASTAGGSTSGSSEGKTSTAGKLGAGASIVATVVALAAFIFLP